MRVVKINAVWCSGCLVMNNVWKKILKVHDIETLSLDYDMNEEEVLTYNPGNILPVFIFYSGDKEVKRVVGEVSYDEMLKAVEGILNEENN